MGDQLRPEYAHLRKVDSTNVNISQTDTQIAFILLVKQAITWMETKTGLQEAEGESGLRATGINRVRKAVYGELGAFRNAQNRAAGAHPDTVQAVRRSTMNEKIKQWLDKSREELDDIYQQAKPGNIPDGDTRGTAIVAGSMLARAYARFARLFAWQGKVFDMFPPDKKQGILINKITAFSLTFVVAKVYKDKSWMDGQDTIVIDYSKTSFFCKKIRDEIREVAPGVYLGKVWWGKTRILDFALTYEEAD